MVFRIFTPSEARSMGEKRAAHDADRAQTLANTTKELLQTKDEVEQAFDETMRQQRREQEAWEEEKRERKNKLLSEIEELEERHERALIPLTSREAIIKSAEDALKQRESEAGVKEAENEDTSRRLMAKLDAVYTREEDVKTGEKRLKVRREGVEIQATQVADSARKLNERTDEFNTYVETKENEFAYRESELDARKNLYDENAKLLAKRELNMRFEQERLEDKRKQIGQTMNIKNND